MDVLVVVVVVIAVAIASLFVAGGVDVAVVDMNKVDVGDVIGNGGGGAFTLLAGCCWLLGID